MLTFRDGRQRTVTLGHFPELSLDDARLRTMAYRREAKEGRDPVKKERVKVVSVEQMKQFYNDIQFFQSDTLESTNLFRMR